MNAILRALMLYLCLQLSLCNHMTPVNVSVVMGRLYSVLCLPCKSNMLVNLPYVVERNISLGTTMRVKVLVSPNESRGQAFVTVYNKNIDTFANQMAAFKLSSAGEHYVSVIVYDSFKSVALAFSDFHIIANGSCKAYIQDVSIMVAKNEYERNHTTPSNVSVPCSAGSACEVNSGSSRYKKYYNIAAKYTDPQSGQQVYLPNTQIQIVVYTQWDKIGCPDLFSPIYTLPQSGMISGIYMDVSKDSNCHPKKTYLRVWLTNANGGIAVGVRAGFFSTTTFESKWEDITGGATSTLSLQFDCLTCSSGCGDCNSASALYNLSSTMYIWGASNFPLAPSNWRLFVDYSASTANTNYYASDISVHKSQSNSPGVVGFLIAGYFMYNLYYGLLSSDIPNLSRPTTYCNSNGNLFGAFVDGYCMALANVMMTMGYNQDYSVFKYVTVSGEEVPMFDMEYYHCTFPVASGDLDSGRVSAALWDLFDGFLGNSYVWSTGLSGRDCIAGKEYYGDSSFYDHNSGMGASTVFSSIIQASTPHSMAGYTFKAMYANFGTMPALGTMDLFGYNLQPYSKLSVQNSMFNCPAVVGGYQATFAVVTTNGYYPCNIPSTYLANNYMTATITGDLYFVSYTVNNQCGESRYVYSQANSQMLDGLVMDITSTFSNSITLCKNSDHNTCYTLAISGV